MDYTRDTGWYYSSINNRAPAWTGVEFLYRFLTASRGKGPRAIEIPILNAKPGDVVQLSFNGETFAHSLLVVGVAGGEIFITTHTDDADNRLLRSYIYRKCRLLHITEVNG